MKQILTEHMKKYPESELIDLVKLLYQSEFAGGHMIADRGSSLRRIKEELEAVRDLKLTEKSAAEPIGGGLVRLSLLELKNSTLSPETLNAMFAATAENNKGSMEGLERKLALLTDCCRDGSLPFAPETAENRIADYRRRGCPHPGHSDRYRAAYKPAYRVVEAGFGRFLRVFEELDRLMTAKERIICAVDGSSGAGKSTLAQLIKRVYSCNVFHMDDFFLTPCLRTEERLTEPGGNVDYVRFKNEVLEPVRQKKTVSFRRYDCSAQKLLPPETVEPSGLTVIEGVYSLHPYFKDPYDLKILLKINAEEQMRRILERSGPVLYKRFEEEWIPMENLYFSTLGVKGDLTLEE